METVESWEKTAQEKIDKAKRAAQSAQEAARMSAEASQEAIIRAERLGQSAQKAAEAAIEDARQAAEASKKAALRVSESWIGAFRELLAGTGEVDKTTTLAISKAADSLKHIPSEPISQPKVVAEPLQQEEAEALAAEFEKAMGSGDVAAKKKEGAEAHQQQIQTRLDILAKMFAANKPKADDNESEEARAED
jgi:hypothetical protein